MFFLFSLLCTEHARNSPNFPFESYFQLLTTFHESSQLMLDSGMLHKCQALNFTQSTCSNCELCKLYHKTHEKFIKIFIFKCQKYTLSSSVLPMTLSRWENLCQKKKNSNSKCATHTGKLVHYRFCFQSFNINLRTSCGCESCSLWNKKNSFTGSRSEKKVAANHHKKKFEKS